MTLHPMPEFGSFCLLLALMLAIYTLVVGGISLWASSSQRKGSPELAPQR